MVYSKNLGFCILTSDVDIDDEVVDILKGCFEKNKSLFNRVPFKFKVVVCDNLDGFNKEVGSHHLNCMFGLTLKDKKIVLKSFGLSEKSCTELGYYKDIFMHELNHLFWFFSFGTFKPGWIREGLACFISKSFLLDKSELNSLCLKHHIKSSLLDYRGLKRNISGSYFPVYPVWANFVAYLSDKYSVNTIIDFLGEYSERSFRDNYDKLFIKFFGRSDVDLFDEWISGVKNKQLLP